MRKDLKLAAFAVALGYRLGIAGSNGPRDFGPDRFDSTGVPHDSLSFDLGPVSVWNTARGWRVGRVQDGYYLKPTPEDFHGENLNKALRAGAELAAKHGGPAAPDPEIESLVAGLRKARFDRQSATIGGGEYEPDTLGRAADILARAEAPPC